ncbi:Transcriptional repressor NF-X1, partial [Hypocenomyce scalaris]|nr:Transcriptional repressor NF-X1 [Hypocenomyce scalaris]
MATANVAPPSTQISNAPSRRRRGWRKPPRNGEQGPVQGDGQNNTPDSQARVGGEGHAQLARDALLDLRPASVAPRSQERSTRETSSAENSAVENGIPRGPRSRRGRAGRGGETQNTHGPGVGSSNVGGSNAQIRHGPEHTMGRGTMVSSGRQFGGRLTTDMEQDQSSPLTSSLQADAPEFRPGQQHPQRTVPARRGKVALPKLGAAGGRTPRLRRGSSLKSAAPDIATRTHEDIANGVYECPICTSE